MGERGSRETEELSILTYPTRYDIYLTLKNSKQPMYASQIARELGIDRKLVSFHLSALEKHGFVTSDIGIANPENTSPKAVKYYTITDKADKIITNFIKSVQRKK